MHSYISWKFHNHELFNHSTQESKKSIWVDEEERKKFIFFIFVLVDDKRYVFCIGRRPTIEEQDLLYLLTSYPERKGLITVIFDFVNITIIVIIIITNTITVMITILIALKNMKIAQPSPAGC